MENRKYIIKEKAFIDVWDKYDNVEEINGVEKCFEFLNDLISVTEGQVIVDHFSGSNYDHIQRVELVGKCVYIYWKDFEEKPLAEDWMSEIFGYATYMYTICNLRKIKILNLKGHLYILFLPNVISLKQAKNLLGISSLQEGKEILVAEDSDTFSTSLRFLKDGKLHECTLFSYPFFSFLIQPKENNTNAGVSGKILMYETLAYTEQRINQVNIALSLSDEHDYDEIQSIGNRLRTILESIVKYYCLYMDYSLPKKDNYGSNMLGELRKHLVKNNDDIVDRFSQEVITSANNYSHDIGIIYTKDDTKKLLQSIHEILLEVGNKIENKEY
ncbi:hypothetical protein [Paenibacillus sp. FSL R5-0810]|uniref:hypothetical protein n=1 Tax=Paenibacillus sp. FSL R5-0810 TaxID=2921659 RepID=UPI0030F522DC